MAAIRSNTKAKQASKKPGATNLPHANKITVQRQFGNPEANESLAVVEYHKTCATSMRVMAEDVTTRSTKHKSYDLYWFVPGQGVVIDPAAGVACHLKHTAYVLENYTDYTLYVRMQRPMGYKTSPSVIGMWEPMGTKVSKQENALFEIRPRSKRSFSVSNVSTSYMVARHAMKNGKVAVHLASLAVFRDILNDHGNKVPPEGVAFTLSAETHFRVNDGKVGSEKGYLVETFDTAERMDYVNAGPPVSTLISDLTTPKGTVDCVVVDRSNVPELAKNKNMVIKAKSGGVWTEHFQGLDTSCWYMLPYPVLADISGDKRSCSVIEYDAKNDVWLLGCVYSVSNGADTISSPSLVRAQLPGDTKGVVTVFVGSESFIPASLNTIRPVNMVTTARKTRVISSVRAIRPPARGFEELEAFSVETILDSIVMIVDVVRVVAAFAAALGFLAEDTNILKSAPGDRNISSN